MEYGSHIFLNYTNDTKIYSCNLHIKIKDINLIEYIKIKELLSIFYYKNNLKSKF